jgi:hypothetical protein
MSNRVIARNELLNASSGRDYALISQLELKDPAECTMDDLKGLRVRIPMSYREFQIAIQLAYKLLGGSRSAFEGRRTV